VRRICLAPQSLSLCLLDGLVQRFLVLLAEIKEGWRRGEERRGEKRKSSQSKRQRVGLGGLEI